MWYRSKMLFLAYYEKTRNNIFGDYMNSLFTIDCSKIHHPNEYYMYGYKLLPPEVREKTIEIYNTLQNDSKYTQLTKVFDNYESLLPIISYLDTTPLLYKTHSMMRSSKTIEELLLDPICVALLETLVYFIVTVIRIRELDKQQILMNDSIYSKFMFRGIFLRGKLSNKNRSFNSWSGTIIGCHSVLKFYMEQFLTQNTQICIYIARNSSHFHPMVLLSPFKCECEYIVLPFSEYNIISDFVLDITLERELFVRSITTRICDIFKISYDRDLEFEIDTLSNLIEEDKMLSKISNTFNELNRLDRKIWENTHQLGFYSIVPIRLIIVKDITVPEYK